MERLLIVGLSGLFALQGLSWMVLGAFDPFGLYSSMLATHIGSPDGLGPEARDVQRFLMIPFGATDAAYFALTGAIAWSGFYLKWCWRAVAASFALWIVADTTACVFVGAWFNVLVVNVPCLVMFGGALALWWRKLRTP